MGTTELFIVVTGVAMANILSFGFLWSAFQLHKAEQNGHSPQSYKFIMLFCLMWIVVGGLLVYWSN
jgi:hypothetical protein